MLPLFLTTVIIMIFDFFFLMQKVQRRDSLALWVSRGRMQDTICWRGPTSGTALEPTVLMATFWPLHHTEWRDQKPAPGSAASRFSTS